MNQYLSGKKLYGDDFSLKQIKSWYNDEKEGYSSLPEATRNYEFFALNNFHGFSKIKGIKKFRKVLGFGSAYGDELLPIAKKADQIFIIEPSKKLRAKSLEGKKLIYKIPSVNGKIPFPSNSFDLITCFGVIHHIPNVSKILSEFARVLAPGGIILMREPIVSMGDWNNSRKGLTKHERGIPLNLLREMIKNNNLEIISERKVLFPIIRRIKIGKKYGCNIKLFVLMDYILSILFSWNNKYHSTNFLHKLRPQSVFYVLKKK